MIIANSLYDTVFKRLMKNQDVASKKNNPQKIEHQKTELAKKETLMTELVHRLKTLN
jgi:hypothetical protein